jgi:N-acylneuraminate cytidylyltransferase
MIAGKRALAVIPARGGSKGVPGKNIRPLGGRPLIAWTIAAAKDAPELDRVIISSDDTAVIETARAWGGEVPFVRPADLARDDTQGIAPVLHALDTLPDSYDYVVLLQPTSPLRTSADISAALKICVEDNALACVSVSVPPHAPWWMFRLDAARHLQPLFPQDDLPSRRQEMPEVYALNGAVYVAKVSWLRESGSFLTPATVAYVMPPERALDIDTELDFKLVEAVIGQAT